MYVYVRVRIYTYIPYSRDFLRTFIFREFREFLLVAEILGATPSSRSAPTWVWSGFGLIAKIFFAKFAPVIYIAIRENIGPRKNPAIRYIRSSIILHLSTLVT